MRMNYFNFHLGDYAKSTGHLSPLEHGMYLLLLTHYYATEAPIPSPPSSTARICRAVTEEEREAVASVLRMFFREKDGAYHNDRVDQEIAAYKSKSAKAEAAGRASGEARRLKHSEKSERTFNGRSTDVPLEFNNPNNQEPIANNHKPITSTQSPKPPLPEQEDFRFDDPSFDKPRTQRFPLPEKVEAGIRELYSRRPSTRWSEREIREARKLSQINEQDLLDDIELFYEARKRGWQYYRKDIATLLCNWSAEVERAGDFMRSAPSTLRPAFARA